MARRLLLLLSLFPLLFPSASSFSPASDWVQQQLGTGTPEYYSSCIATQALGVSSLAHLRVLASAGADAWKRRLIAADGPTTLESECGRSLTVVETRKLSRAFKAVAAWTGNGGEHGVDDLDHFDVAGLSVEQLLQRIPNTALKLRLLDLTRRAESRAGGGNPAAGGLMHRTLEDLVEASGGDPLRAAQQVVGREL